MMFLYAQKKGGVGKTTLAVTHAVYLYDLGFSVALLDADEQCQSAEWVTEAEPNITIRTELDADEAFIVAQELAATHDFVIADGPATLGDATRALLTLTDVAIIPMGPSVLDLRSTDKIQKIIHTSRQISGGYPKRATIVINKAKQNTRITREIKDAVSDLDIEVLDAMVRDLQAFPDSVQQGTVVTRMIKPDIGARKAKADLEKYFASLSLPVSKAANE